MVTNTFSLSSPPTRLVIASRQSRLAMWQAEHVRAQLQTFYPSCTIDILGMTTRGDQIIDRPLAQIGGKGLFIKELEHALAEGRADLAVHSLKDIPMALPTGFQLAAILNREDPYDAFISNKYAHLDDLPHGSVVGTSSLRRAAQLSAYHPGITIKPLRGNLDTRLGKLDNGDYDAIILATAGLKRLQLTHRIRANLSPNIFVPAVGQGALGIEICAERAEIATLLAPLHHQPTALAVAAERSLSALFGGSCQLPLAAYGEWNNDNLHLHAMVGLADGSLVIRDQIESKVTTITMATALGEHLGQRLRTQGADKILAACHSPQS